MCTHCLFNTDDEQDIYDHFETMARTRQSLFVPVRLHTSKTDPINPLTRPERTQKWKTTPRTVPTTGSWAL